MGRWAKGICNLAGFNYNPGCSGRGAAWLARTVRVGEVVGSRHTIRRLFSGRFYSWYNRFYSGHGAAWLARTVRVGEVVGSNPAAPTEVVKTAVSCEKRPFCIYPPHQPVSQPANPVVWQGRG